MKEKKRKGEIKSRKMKELKDTRETKIKKMDA